MDLKAFRSEGYLLEANRQFFHPLGLTLGVQRELNDDGTLGDVIGLVVEDFRDDPEGCRFELTPNDLELASNVHREILLRRPVREAALGYWIEPFPEHTDGVA